MVTGSHRVREQAIFYVLAAIASFPTVRAQTSFSVGNVPGQPGATVAVPVNLRQPPASVAAVQFDVVFNSAKVSAGVPNGSARLANHTIRSREIAPGVHRTLIYSLDNAVISGTNGAIVHVPFTLAPQETVGAGPLAPANVILARDDGTVLAPVSLSAGTIFVRPANRRPDGIVDFFLPSRPDEKYVIQATTNFVTWENLSTNVAYGDFMQLVDMDGPCYPYRFYRSALFDTIIPGFIDKFQRADNGAVTFQITGLPARSYTIQASTDLANWTDLATRIPTGASISFTDPDAPNYSRRFYRLKSGP